MVKFLKLSVFLLFTSFFCAAQNDFTQNVNGVSFSMIFVEGGSFNRGCTNEQNDLCKENEFPKHKVSLSDFYIAKFPVTQELYFAVMDTITSQIIGCPNCPVETVSWFETQTFIEKLNLLTGKNFRLPTEAEWEFAARGGTKSKNYIYAGGNSLDLVGWYSAHKLSKMQIVGMKNPNEIGVYDMSGNVWEWCNDWFAEYDDKDETNPKGPQNGRFKVLRGGSWATSENNCRVSRRHRYFPATKTYDFGFRLVHDID